MPHSSFLSWYHENIDDNNNTNNGGNRNSIHGDINDNSSNHMNTTTINNLSLAKLFDIDTKNISGSLKIRIMIEGAINSMIEIARLEIPVFNLIECCCTLEQNEYYDRWFPLFLTSEYITCEGDTERYLRNNIGTEQLTHSVFEHQPCIRLRIRWIDNDRINKHHQNGNNNHNSSTTNNNSNNSNSKNNSDQTLSDESKLYARLQLPSLSISLIDSIYAREVMQISIRGVDLRHYMVTEYTDTNLNITWIQVDNQLPDPTSSVILSPTRVKYHQPIIRLHIRKKNLLSQGKLTSYATIQIIIQELDLRLEQKTIIASWNLIKSFIQEHRNHNNNTSHHHHTKLGDVSSSSSLLPDSTAKVFSTEADGITQQQQQEIMMMMKQNYSKFWNYDDEENVNTMYVEHFRIETVKLNVSFITTPQIFQSGKYTNKTRSELRYDNNNIINTNSSNFNLFFWQIGEVILDLTSTINDAPIIFNGFSKSHMFKSSNEIIETLQSHYLNSALGQLYKIVGSLELVGNPIGLLTSLGTGVRDFFYEPAHALITTPTEIGQIGRGVVRGTRSLVSKTTVGFLNTGINFTRAVGRGFSKLSMNKEYMSKREKLQRSRNTVQSKVMRPIEDIYNGFYFGIVGIVKAPYSNVKRKGIVKGLLPGVAKV